jgi:D-sedoheptulose 7-phosphate isomerase
MKIAQEVKKAKRVFLCGNGGSAANALHIANDLIGCGIKAHALTGDISTLTAIANDASYEEIFAKQIEVLGEPGDLLIALSGSGKSPNILAALKAAHSRGMRCAAIVGDFNAEPPAQQLADITCKWGADMQEAEEKQLLMGHRIMRWLKRS